MFDGMLFYLFICLLFFGIGDFLGVLTKAKLSSVFVSLFLFLICFMTGLIPPDIINQAGLTQIGKWAVGFVVFSMGTTINLRELAQEWRTVATACVSMAVIWIGMIVLIPLVGYNETIVAIPIINGGIVATQIMTSAAMENGLTMAAAFGTILYAVQKFFGTPFASYFGLREARLVLAEYRRTGINPNKAQPKVENGEVKPTYFDNHKKFYGPFLCLAITGFFTWIASIIGSFTGLSYTIWCLVLGACMSSTGYVPKNILGQAKSSGIFNVAVFATIIPSLARIDLNDLWVLSYSTIIMFIVVFVLLYVSFGILPLWRIQGKKNVALGVAAAQLLGFPATYLIANEVATAAAENEEEKQVVLDAIMSKYLVAGFTTVTSVSVIIAGFFEKFIVV